MSQDILALAIQHGILLAFVNVFLEQIGLPVPAVPTLIVSGALAADGHFSAPALFSAAFVACLIADGAWYIAGRKYGARVMKTLCKISLSPDSCVRQTEASFERWGVGIIVFSKFLPGLSTITPPLAGAMRLSWISFLFFNSLGITLWAGAAIGVGLLLHTEIGPLLDRLEDMGGVAITLIVSLLAAYIAFKWWERRRFYKMLRMARITVDELQQQIHAGLDPVILDVRSSAARQLDARSIPGALPIELDDLDRHAGQLPADREIVLYCTCPNEASAARVAKQLMDRGFTRVRPLQGGLDAWVAAGYIVHVQVKNDVALT